jgi:hypothetical protein
MAENTHTLGGNYALTASVLSLQWISHGPVCPFTARPYEQRNPRRCSGLATPPLSPPIAD